MSASAANGPPDTMGFVPNDPSGVCAITPLASTGYTDNSLAVKLLQTMQDHIGDIRDLIHCGVCVKLLYEPFTLACGHTFCYSCLTQWFANHRRKKTCPDCRASVRAQPAPAFLVREIVQMFINRPELLENNETTAEHLSIKRIETEKMETDKRNKHPTTGGLFQGCFKHAAFNGPINDVTDGVRRCPVCAWELEGGACTHCGFGHDFTDSESDSESHDESMTDAEDDVEDGFSAIDDDDIAWNEIYDGAFQAAAGGLGFHGPHHFHNHRHNNDGYSMTTDSMDRSEDEDTDDSEMSDFIDDGPIEEGAETDNSTVIGANTFISDSDGAENNGIISRSAFASTRSSRPHIRATISLGEDEESKDEDSPSDSNLDSDLDSDSDSEDDEPIRALRRHASSTSHRRPNRHRNRAATASTPPLSPPNRSGHGLTAGSNPDAPITLEDDSDAPVAPVRRQRTRRRPRPGRNRRRRQAMVSNN
ncbi:hypothetical protein AJ79_07342 [Helicocarpus griseus UAMH5409]|uniref:RING-type domain-containing protein n=1 Tax=Helicocarpus griseus UAMH5409 TaxID=1447875 RepID=A0A2B7X423_9EURO|nr:hypothetical protein AJ79_07342 [Helicocarpus griseus UAMH5409]